MARRAVPKDYPSLALGFPPVKGEDLRSLLLADVSPDISRQILDSCCALISDRSKLSVFFNKHDTAKHLRWKWPGKNLISERHQIILKNLSPKEIEAEFQQIKLLASHLKCSTLTASVMYFREIRNSQQFLRYTSPCVDHELGRLPDYSKIAEVDPEKIAPIGKAAKKINQMVRAGKNIVIVSDYDADGNCSAAIMARAIRAISGKCSIIQPDRALDGYGLSDSVLKKVQNLKPDLVITLDLGTSNKSQISNLKKDNCYTIVVDHHTLVRGKIAEPDIMINPKASKKWQDYQDLSASGLSWLLASSLLGHSGWIGDSKKAETRLLALAAIGTVADVMNLQGLNRAIVHEGLSQIRNSDIPALRVLSKYHQDKDINGEYIGFLVGPLLNAAGRIAPGTESSPGTAVTLEFLLTNCEQRAEQLYSQLISYGAERKKLEEQGLQLARDKMREYQRENKIIHAGIVLAHEGIHEGVAGLVAARICEHMQCPAIVLTRDKYGDWKGSGRAPENLDLMQILNSEELGGLIKQYGGHAAAAGLKISPEKLQSFKNVFEVLCHEIYGITDPQDNPFTSAKKRENELPVLQSVAKAYCPDLILSVDQYCRRKQEIDECRQLIEPCGRGNLALQILLCRVKIVSKELTAAGHLRLVLEDGSNTDWKSSERIEAVVFKKSLIHKTLEQAGQEELFDLLVQSSYDKAKSIRRSAPNHSVNIILAEPTAFTYSTETSKKTRRVSAQASNTPKNIQTELFEQHDLPRWQDMQQFKQHFNITCLSDAVEFRPQQIEFIAKQLTEDKINFNQNLVYKVNTGGGKTIIAFVKAAEVISNNPDAKVLYLVPQHDLLEQTLKSARQVFDLQLDKITELSGQINASKRKASYNSDSKLFIATPQTVQNDGDISMFSFIIIDEIHYMHGDNNTDENTKYAYRWVSEQVKQLKASGAEIQIWAQSGTPAKNKKERHDLLKTLQARWATATLPTGQHQWKADYVNLPAEDRSQLLNLSEAYKECFFELKNLLPDWVSNILNESAISKEHGEFGRAMRSFIAAHDSNNNKVFTARSKLLEERANLLKATDQLEEEFIKRNSTSENSDWLWRFRSHLTELELISRLFDELRIKGRLSLSRTVCKKMLEAIYAEKQPPKYVIRAFNRKHIKKLIAWSQKETTASSVASEFEKVFAFNAAKTERQKSDWHVLLGAEPQPSKQKEIVQILSCLDTRLKAEMSASRLEDPKELRLFEIIKSLPPQAKIIVMCEKKFEAEILANRLSNQDIKAAWYAGKSVAKSAGLKLNLEKLRNGEIQVLCSTSAADTGHDIEGVTHIIRISALTSPVKNAQTRGRVARQKGLSGEYITLLIRDDNHDIDESNKMLIARSRLKAMENI